MNEEEAEQFVAVEVITLPPGPAGDPFNFINEVLHFLARWCAAYQAPVVLGSPAYCCFVGYERVARAVEGREKLVERPLLRDDTPQDLLDQVYLCSIPFNRAYAFQCKFSNLGECERETAKLGGAPVVIFNAAERRVLWKTTNDGPFHQVILRGKTAEKLASKDFEKALEEFHREYTETPDGLSDPWDNAAEFLTKPKLEREIRNDLYVHLRNLMQDHLAVFREFFGSSGRADLFVNFYSEKQIFYVELKILRGYRRRKGFRVHVSPKFNAWWGKKGIAQAHSYKRSNRGRGIAYACCFDARETHDEIAELMDLAKKLDVRYMRFAMYSSADKLHEALMT